MKIGTSINYIEKLSDVEFKLEEFGFGIYKQFNQEIVDKTKLEHLQYNNLNSRLRKAFRRFKKHKSTKSASIVLGIAFARYEQEKRNYKIKKIKSLVIDIISIGGTILGIKKLFE